MLKYCILAVFLISSAYGLGSYKHVTVKGQIGCGDKKYPDVTVELWEKDRADPDDLLNTTKTDREGRFTIYGGQNEVGNIEPYLRVIHSCDNGKINPKCEIKDTFTIQKEHINKVYDMGIVSMNIAREDHKKKCKK